MLADLIYEAKGSIIYTKVIDLDPVTFEGSYEAEGKLRDGSIIKEYCTFRSTRRSRDIVYGEGKHLLLTNDNETIRWIGRGFGKRINDKQVWRGSGIFASDLSMFNDIVGVVEAEIIDDNIEIKVWEWR